jgi:hypothetical protein
MSPAGRTWGVNNKAGSLSNSETGVIESGKRRENTRTSKAISTRKMKKTHKKMEGNPEVTNTNQSAPGTDKPDRKSGRFSKSA